MRAFSLGVVLVAVLAGCSSRSGEEASGGGGGSTSPGSSGQSISPSQWAVEFTIQTDQLAGEYSTNPARADQKFRDRIGETWVTALQMHQSGGRTVAHCEVPGTLRYRHVAFEFASDVEAAKFNVSNRELYLLRGRCRGLKDGVIAFVDVRVVRTKSIEVPQPRPDAKVFNVP